MEKILKRVVDLKITLTLQKGRFLLMLLYKHVLITRDKLPRYGRIINSSFFSTVNVTRVYQIPFIQKDSNAIVNHFDAKRIFS